MTIITDYADPCAVLPRIREAYYALLEGRRPEVIEFDAGNGAPTAPIETARQGAPAPQPTARLEEAAAAARLEERGRIRAIVNSEAAEGRKAQALMLATETSLSVAEAEKILTASPKESRIETLAQRAAAGPEFGASRDPEPPNPNARAEEGWKRAIARANRRFEKA